MLYNLVNVNNRCFITSVKHGLLFPMWLLNNYYYTEKEDKAKEIKTNINKVFEEASNNWKKDKEKYQKMNKNVENKKFSSSIFLSSYVQNAMLNLFPKYVEKVTFLSIRIKVNLFLFFFTDRKKNR